MSNQHHKHSLCIFIRKECFLLKVLNCSVMHNSGMQVRMGGFEMFDELGESDSKYLNDSIREGRFPWKVKHKHIKCAM